MVRYQKVHGSELIEGSIQVVATDRPEITELALVEHVAAAGATADDMRLSAETVRWPRCCGAIHRRRARDAFPGRQPRVYGPRIMANDDLSDRVTDLEVKVAYQDQTVIALDEVVRELAGRITALEAELGRIRALGAPPSVDGAAPTPSE